MSYYNLKEHEDFHLDPSDLLKSLPPETDFLILCNPNNPTSSAVRQENIETILSECKKRGIFVMIDETYVEFAPCIEEITAMLLTKIFDNLMVIRGVSKFYAAPGTPPRLRRHRQPGIFVLLETLSESLELK